MKESVNRYRNNDQGFSLIELIVSILIMSVISAMVVMLISSSRATYNQVNTDAVIQADVETVRKYIGELALEARSWGQGTYTYALDGHTVSAEFIWLKALDNETEGVNRGDYTVSGETDSRLYYYYVFLLRPDGYLAYGKYKYDNQLLGTDGKLFSEGFKFPDKDKFDNNIISSPYAVLAENVTEISCPNSTPSTEPELLNVTMKIEYNDHTYDATMNFSGRNKVSTGD